jgi:hypothetical protein
MEKRSNRYKCPFNHDESKYNFSIKEEYWHCFSCNKSGDKIGFVAELFKTTPNIAVKKIVSAFNISNTKIDENYLKELDIKKKMREREHIRSKIAEFKLKEALDKKIKNLNLIMYNNKPYKIDKLENYCNTTSVDRYLNALKQLYEISMFSAIIDEMDLLEFDKEYNNTHNMFCNGLISNGYSFYLFPNSDNQGRT